MNIQKVSVGLDLDLRVYVKIAIQSTDSGRNAFPNQREFNYDFNSHPSNGLQRSPQSSLQSATRLRKVLYISNGILPQ